MMTRAIRLTKIHAIQWYGYSDTIPIDGNALLAGVTGSGKSVLMDLIQLVLVGDERLTRFNQSATGDRSTRDLKGYCLGDTKLEEDGVAQYMRNASVSYIALEFSWPQDERQETWGFRIEFTSTADQHGSKTPFFVPGALTRADFLDSGRHSLELTPFKELVESRSCPVQGTHGRTYVGLEEYLRDMAQPAHLNFDRNVLRSLLPTALSFTFLQDFDEFCRGYILPPEKIDISAVNESYRAFMSFESELTRLKDELERLNTICELFTQFDEQTRDCRLARYLELERLHLHAKMEFEDADAELTRLNKAHEAEGKRLGELDEIIPRRRGDLDSLKALINGTEDGRVYSLITGRMDSLDAEIGTLKSVHEKVKRAVSAHVRKARDWANRVRSEAALGLEEAIVSRLGSVVEAASVADVESVAESLRDLHAAIDSTRSALNSKVDPKRRRLRELEGRRDVLVPEIAALEIGRLPFPTRLLDALNNALPSRNGELRAQPLCKVCEVNDERWRGAAEVAFTQKFAILVSEEDYPLAEKIFYELRADSPRESLINPRAALELSRPVLNGSLAERLETDHPVARAVISHLFGEMMCVEQLDDLGDHRRHPAVTLDGFVVLPPFASRPHHYDELPFLGLRGLEQQLEVKRDELRHIDAELEKLAPVVGAISELEQGAVELAQTRGSQDSDIVRLERLPQLRREQEELTERLSSLDRAHFDQLEKQAKELAGEIERLEGEQKRLYLSPNRSQLTLLRMKVAGYEDSAKAAAENFDKVRFDPWFSLFLGRLDELLQGVLAMQLPLDKAAAKFREMSIESDKSAAVARTNLLAERRALRERHHRYDDDEYKVEAADNGAYQRSYATLKVSEIPAYQEKAKAERKGWAKLFRTQVLDKLDAALLRLETDRKLLNDQLKRPIGNDRYRITKTENPEFHLYLQLIRANSLAKEGELFYESADAELRDAMDVFVRTLADEKSAAATRLLDYRRYYTYDMEVVDVTQPHAPPASLNRQSGKFSGGENQSPYFIAIMAAYLRAYKRHDIRMREPALCLVPIDEAFSKLSGDRIKDCIDALGSLRLQGVFSMSTGNVPYALKLCDSLIVISKKKSGSGKSTKIRNFAVSLARDSEEAQRFVSDL